MVLADKSWEAVEINYRASLGGKEPWRTNAERLLELIPIIRNAVELESVIPGISLQNLSLRRPPQETRVCIHAVDKELYSVSPNGGETQIIVTQDKVVETLIYYFDLIKARDDLK